MYLNNGNKSEEKEACGLYLREIFQNASKIVKLLRDFKKFKSK